MQNFRNVFYKANIFGSSENKLILQLISVQFFQLNSTGAGEQSCAIQLRHYWNSSTCRKYMQFVYNFLLNMGELINITEALENA